MRKAKISSFPRTANTMRRIEVGAGAEVNRIRKAEGNTGYMYTLPTLYTWQDNMGLEIEFFEDAYLVKIGERGDKAFLFH